MRGRCQDAHSSCSFVLPTFSATARLPASAFPSFFAHCSCKLLSLVPRRTPAAWRFGPYRPQPVQNLSELETPSMNQALDSFLSSSSFFFVFSFNLDILPLSQYIYRWPVLNTTPHTLLQPQRFIVRQTNAEVRVSDLSPGGAGSHTLSPSASLLSPSTFEQRIKRTEISRGIAFLCLCTASR